MHPKYNTKRDNQGIHFAVNHVKTVTYAKEKFTKVILSYRSSETIEIPHQNSCSNSSRMLCSVGMNAIQQHLWSMQTNSPGNHNASLC